MFVNTLIVFFGILFAAKSSSGHSFDGTYTFNFRGEDFELNVCDDSEGESGRVYYSLTSLNLGYIISTGASEVDKYKLYKEVTCDAQLLVDGFASDDNIFSLKYFYNSGRHTFKIVGFIDRFISRNGVTLDGPVLDQNYESRCLRPYFPYTNSSGLRPENWPLDNEQYVTDPPFNFAPGAELVYQYYDSNGIACYIFTDPNLVYQNLGSGANYRYLFDYKDATFLTEFYNDDVPGSDGFAVGSSLVVLTGQDTFFLGYQFRGGVGGELFFTRDSSLLQGITLPLCEPRVPVRLPSGAQA